MAQVDRKAGKPAAGGQRVLAALRTARAEVRERVRRLAGEAAPDAGGHVVDIDGVLVLAHPEKQEATVTGKKTFGHHPLTGFVDHGRGGSGEPVVGLLRPGNSGSHTSADHIRVTNDLSGLCLDGDRRGDAERFQGSAVESCCRRGSSEREVARLPAHRDLIAPPLAQDTTPAPSPGRCGRRSGPGGQSCGWPPALFSATV